MIIDSEKIFKNFFKNSEIGTPMIYFIYIERVIKRG